MRTERWTPSACGCAVAWRAMSDNDDNRLRPMLSPGLHRVGAVHDRRMDIRGNGDRDGSAGRQAERPDGELSGRIGGTAEAMRRDLSTRAGGNNAPATVIGLAHPVEDVGCRRSVKACAPRQQHPKTNREAPPPGHEAYYTTESVDGPRTAIAGADGAAQACRFRGKQRWQRETEDSGLVDSRIGSRLAT